ncbi:FAD-dependent 5-carboxymethylaminomethyl-2-thiouridine(34) oxidoreductase MnmC [Pseudaquabacterium pictum]|uniref:tRNA 5-methylaminomethyl-2-thiouridine biosynthesis bifunctional protein MnmC n=1 Tax=Pseudaquabacterium pictum TaxID=2315236 RepID=A0A480ATB7_9BURK|nr:FAD-dependent 5-carboxymethylaminomethyl-2-thiouridine(34) oxidoreductase MnmC [Rubrivivax pictus]GCL63342.1 tRNA 5-methylaminomethyl-2-thiouridine biosynthesis bifunctional protein MnmC [Rubrivivax pictus]
MSWGPLQPARIDFSDAQVPSAPDFGDLYHARAGALGQARHVFLAGNGLPGRWAGRRRFVVLETGFGLGHNFLATWDAWQQDARRCDTLWYVVIEKHPPRRDDMARAHAASPLPALSAELLRAWPPLTPDMHLVDLAGGRVRLLLAFGDIAQVLPELVLQADAFYLDGFAPDRNPAMWDPWRLRQLPRLAAPGATLATWSVASAVRQGLQAAGFQVEKRPGWGGKREMTAGVFAPRFTPPAPPGRQPLTGVQTVAVVGAGLAGAATAAALARRGLAVQVIDRQAGPARETSGNAGGLFHGVVHAQDGVHARWLRAAALQAARVLQPLIDSGAVPGAMHGLLRGEQALTSTAMQQLLDNLALPPDYLQVQPQGAGAAWLYPGGGWAAPAALSAHWLQHPGIACRWGTTVQALQPTPAGWRLLGADGQVLAEVDAVVLCNAADTQRLAGADWPLQTVRGQTTLLPAGLPGAPTLPRPVADAGYVLPLADGRLLCGATSQRGDADPTVRWADHQHNLSTLARLTGWSPPANAGQLDGRVGWRLLASDRLPLLGPLPAAGTASSRPADQPRRVPRQPGLAVFTALGSRGITQAPLGADLLAAWLTGDPLPVPAALVDALDVARFGSRAVRRAARPSVE